MVLLTEASVHAPVDNSTGGCAVYCSNGGVDVILVNAGPISKAAVNCPLCRRRRWWQAMTAATSRGVIRKGMMEEVPAVNISTIPTATMVIIWAAAAVGHCSEGQDSTSRGQQGGKALLAKFLPTLWYKRRFSFAAIVAVFQIISHHT